MFAILAFRLSIIFVLVSRYATYLPLSKKFFSNEADKLSIQRMIGISLLLCLLLAVSRGIFGDFEVVSSFVEYFRIGPDTLGQVVWALFVNSVLFAGNIYYLVTHSSLGERLSAHLEPSERVSTIKTLLVAPFIEEAVYTVFLYCCYRKWQLEGDAYFAVVSSVCFGISHMHMKWDEIKLIYKKKELSLGVRLLEMLDVSKVIMLVTFLFSLYAKTVFVKSKNFWPCFTLHAYCNLLGLPKTGFAHDVVIHGAALASTVLLLTVF